MCALSKGIHIDKTNGGQIDNCMIGWECMDNIDNDHHFTAATLNSLLDYLRSNNGLDAIHIWRAEMEQISNTYLACSHEAIVLDTNTNPASGAFGPAVWLTNVGTDGGYVGLDVKHCTFLMANNCAIGGYWRIRNTVNECSHMSFNGCIIGGGAQGWGGTCALDNSSYYAPVMLNNCSIVPNITNDSGAVMTGGEHSITLINNCNFWYQNEDHVAIRALHGFTSVSNSWLGSDFIYGVLSSNGGLDGGTYQESNTIKVPKIF